VAVDTSAMRRPIDVEKVRDLTQDRAAGLCPARRDASRVPPGNVIVTMSHRASKRDDLVVGPREKRTNIDDDR